MAPPHYDLYEVGNQSTYTFNFQLLPNVRFRRTLRDWSFDLNAKPVPYDQLPEDVRKQAEQLQNTQIHINVAPPRDTPPRP
jgi:hypothetical protein